MVTAERIDRERQFHDAQAADRARTFAANPGRLVFDDDEYFDHESWIRPAFTRLGPLSGRQVLDWGCGHGMAAVVMARGGADVLACDVSSGYVAEAQLRAELNGVKVHCFQADAHRLPLPSASLDAVWGHAILHHLDVPSAAAELRRVLRPAGIAVLCEPWAGNPLVQAARQWLAGCGHHTADERPLAQRDLAKLRTRFSKVQVEGFQLFSSAKRLIRPRTLQSILVGGDERLLRRWPALQRFGRYVVITLRP